MRPRTYGPKPFCLCGCGRRIKERAQYRKGVRVEAKFYDIHCYSKSELKKQYSRELAEKLTHKRRYLKFKRHLDRLGKRFAQGDLLYEFEMIAQYYTDVERNKWLRKQQKPAA